MTKTNRIPYVEAHAGWRAFFVAILSAAVLGLGFRLYFSPTRLTSWAREAIEQQKKAAKHPFAVSFEKAELSLARRNVLPEFALVLSGVKIAPLADCHPEASIFIGRLKLPFRLQSMATGNGLAIGLIVAEDMRVDLDGLRARCGTGANGEAAQAASPISPAPARPKISETRVQPWWTDEQFEKARAHVEGIEFARATLQFEDRRKEVYLDSFKAVFRSAGRIDLATEMRLPPPVVYGEQVPPLKISGEATSSKAKLLVSVRVSEGSLDASADFKAGDAGALLTDAHFKVSSLPLSMMTPLLRKADLVDQKFDPKFLWLDCEASIAGAFQGLFQNNALNLQGCRIEGDGTDIQLRHAERLPSGEWTPFDVEIVSLDLAKLLATVGGRGPDGIVSQYGRLKGQLHFEATDRARFNGALRGAALSFSNQSVRAIQAIDSLDVKLEIARDRVKAVLNEPLLAVGGEMVGSAIFDLDRSLSNGTVDLKVKKLVLEPGVQNVLVKGTLGAIDGAAEARIAASRVTDFNLRLRVGTTEGALVKFGGLEIASDRKGEAPPRLVLESPEIGLKRESSFVQALEPAFFGHHFEDEWISLSRFKVETSFFDASETGDIFEWTRLSGGLENGQIALASEGALNRDHQLTGRLQIDFPLAKKLVWDVRGSMSAPVLVDTESTLKFKTRAEISDAVLGLKPTHR